MYKKQVENRSSSKFYSKVLFLFEIYCNFSLLFLMIFDVYDIFSVQIFYDSIFFKFFEIIKYYFIRIYLKIFWFGAYTLDYVQVQEFTSGSLCNIATIGNPVVVKQLLLIILQESIIANPVVMKQLLLVILQQ